MNDSVLKVDSEDERLDWQDYVVYFEDKPFTGILFENRPDGSPWSEESYRLGFKDGVSRDWHENGNLSSQTHYKLGIAHGLNQEWYPDGQRKKEEEIELGQVLLSREWDEQGNLIKEKRIDQQSDYYQLLLKARANEAARVKMIMDRLSG